MLNILWASLVAQRVKRLPIMQETQVQSLVREDPLEKAMATHSSILAWKIPWLYLFQQTEIQTIFVSLCTLHFFRNAV